MWLYIDSCWEVWLSPSRTNYSTTRTWENWPHISTKSTEPPNSLKRILRSSSRSSISETAKFR